MRPTKLLTLILLFPLLGAIINGVFSLTKAKIQRVNIASIACIPPLLSFVLAGFLFVGMLRAKSNIVFYDSLYTWLHVGKLKVNMAFHLDLLSILFVFILTGVGTLVHIFSIGHMGNEANPRFARYFSLLNLFLFFMLLLVMSDGFVVLLLGWHGAGFVSFLLIGFWYEELPKVVAGKKAYIVTRIADIAFFMGIFLLFWATMNLPLKSEFAFDFHVLQLHASELAKIKFWGVPVVELSSFLLFVGIVGKSVQIPLHIWFPEVVEAPTAVAAFIHAAFVVIAGVYLIAKLHFLFSLAPTTSLFIAAVGSITAVFGALVAVVQNDLNRVLVFSTISQVGLMFIGLGTGAYSSAVFAATTHSFFKTLLVLGAGSVVYSLQGESNIRHMGGLLSKMKVTGVCFAIGTLSMIGFPGLAGSLSHHEILLQAFLFKHPALGIFPGIILWLFALLATALLSFAMIRLFCLCFLGEFRAKEMLRKKLHRGVPHEVPSIMWMPLVFLAGFSIVGGWVNIPSSFKGNHLLRSWLTSYFQISSTAKQSSLEYTLLAIMVAVVVAALCFAAYLYVVKANEVLTTEKRLAQDTEPRPWVAVFQAAKQGFYVQDAADSWVVRPLKWLSSKGIWSFEKHILSGIFRGIGNLFNYVSVGLRWMHQGNIRYFFYAMVFGLVSSLLWLMLATNFPTN